MCIFVVLLIIAVFIFYAAKKLKTMTLDLKDIQQKIDAYLDSPECEEYFQKLKRWNQRVEMYRDKIEERLVSEPTLLDSFLEHEYKFEEMKYNKHNCYTSSRIFNLILDIWREKGAEARADYRRHDFLCGSYRYLGYKIMIFCGQGCFYRVYKGRKLVFQSY